MKNDFAREYEKLVSDPKKDFPDYVKFISALQTDVTYEKIDFYFRLLKDKRNPPLFLALRAFFDKFGGRGERYLLGFLSESGDKNLAAEAITILSGHSYQSKEALPYIRRYMADCDENLRHSAIIALGLVGEENDFVLLRERAEHEAEAVGKGYALSAMRQMYFRIPRLKKQVLECYQKEISASDNGDLILIIAACTQDLLKKRLNITENERGIHAKDTPEAIKAKVIKLLEKYIAHEDSPAL